MLLRIRVSCARVTAARDTTVAARFAPRCCRAGAGRSKADRNERLDEAAVRPRCSAASSGYHDWKT